MASEITAEGTGRDLEHYADRARKLASSALPEPVRIDSGWNCTPSTGSVRCRTPITTSSSHQAVRSRSGARSGSHHQRVVARRHHGIVEPARTPCARRGGSRLVLPCTGSRPRTTRAAERLADRLVAQADAEDRHAPGQPADRLHRDAGLVGGLRARARSPGGSGRSASTPATSIGVVAAHLHLGAQLPEVLDEVVGEAVVVVDHDDPWHRRPLPVALGGGDLDGPEEGAPPCSGSPRTPPPARSRPRCRRRPARGPRRRGTRSCGW